MQPEQIHWIETPSPFGPMLIAVGQKGLCRLSFGTDSAALPALYPDAELVMGGPWAADAVQLIGAIVAGDVPLQTGQALPVKLDLRGTVFQRQIWDYLLTIPAGETRSYADISRALNINGADRAVGSANGANPIAIIVPCHRVIRSDGSLGGYAYGLEMKEALLKREGAIATGLFG